MPTVNQLIRRRLLQNVPDRLPDLDVLRRTERSRDFEDCRMNRKIIGAMRYGRLGAPGKSKFDRVSDMIRRLKSYQVDGNAEHLVDVANLAECEFVEGDGRMTAVDDGTHTEEKS